jgi:N-acetylmuramoyl-L-alanine amidase
MSKIVILDPGHQKGIDAGASANGLFEEDITLDICLRAKPLLEFNDFTVVMTREGDKVPGSFSDVDGCLKARCDIANAEYYKLVAQYGKEEALKRIIFISQHSNSSRNPNEATGAEVYCAPGSTNGRRLADIALYYVCQQEGWQSRGVKEARYKVLMKTECPAILIENGFINNSSDALKLAKEDHRYAIAGAITKTVCDYYGQEYKEKGAAQVQSVQPDQVQQAISLFEQGLMILKG